MNENKQPTYKYEQKRLTHPEVPMDKRQQEIIECLTKNDNAIIVGETGSGKTTRIPDFLMTAFPNTKIAITQPRRVAARSVARYVAERRGSDVGNEVGYQVRFDDKTTEGTQVNFMTDGVLLRKLQNDPLLMEFKIVMVDEAHERSLNIDFTLGLLKKAQAERVARGLDPLKVVVTSATIEKEKFSEYFQGSPMIDVEGRMHPVDVHHESIPVIDYPIAAAEKVKDIVSNTSGGDILIFMPGEDEINKTIKDIQNLKLDNIDPMPLFGAMSPDDQDRIFAKNPKRKVIVSTNIAETSVTIDGVTAVIDSGLIKQKEFDPKTGIESLVTKEHAKSGCEQRKGRAGRTAPGICYRLYTEDDFNQREEYQRPEIARSDLAHVVLAMKKMGIDNVFNFDFIDRPEKENFLHAIETLKALGALDEKEHLTKIGETMSELPLKPELARMLIEAEKYGCTGSISTIAAMMGGTKPVFVRPKDKEDEADIAHYKFKKGGSDFLTALEVWKQWSTSGFNYEWTKDNFLNPRQLFEIREIRNQLLRDLGRLGISSEDIKNDDESIQKCVVAGLIQNLMVSSGSYGYKKIKDTQKYAGPFDTQPQSIFVHPSSSVFRNPSYLIIGSEVVNTKKAYARKCQTVKQEWLPEIAPQIMTKQEGIIYYDVDADNVVESSIYALKDSPDMTIPRQTLLNKEKIPGEFLQMLKNDQFLVAREKYIKLKDLMDMLETSYSIYGLDYYSDVNTLLIKWKEIKKIFNSPRNDYAQLSEELNYIESFFESLKKDKEGRDELFSSLQKDADELSYIVRELTIGNYEQYGISWTDYSRIHSLWFDVSDQLFKDNNLTNLQLVKIRLEEIKKLLGKKTFKSVLGQKIAEAQAGDLKPEVDNFKTQLSKLSHFEQEYKIKKQEKAPEKTQEELKKEFFAKIEDVMFILDQTEESIGVEAHISDKEKLSKLQTKIKDARKELKAIKRDIENDGNLVSLQGKILNITNKAQKVAEEVGYIGGFKNWLDVRKTLMNHLTTVAEREGVEVNETFLKKANPKIAKLSRQNIEISEIDTLVMDILLGIM